MLPGHQHQQNQQVTNSQTDLGQIETFETLPKSAYVQQVSNGDFAEKTKEFWAITNRLYISIPRNSLPRISNELRIAFNNVPVYDQKGATKNQEIDRNTGFERQFF